MEIHSVFLYNLHRFELFKTGLLYKAVVIHVAIVGEVSRIGDVAHVAYLVAQELEGTIDKVKRHKGTYIAQVYIAIHCRATYIHTYIIIMQGSE